MTKLFENDHAPTVAQAHHVAILRLTPYADLAPVRERLTSSVTDLEAAQAAKQKVEYAIIGQNAQIDYDDAKLERIVVDCARAKRGLIGGPKPDTTVAFRQIFSKAPSIGMDGAPDADQDNYVALVLAGLDLPENAALKAQFAGPINDQQATLTAALAEAKRLDGELAKVDAALALAAAKARAVFNEAQLDAASTSKDEALVASLFAFRSARPKKKEEPQK